jgi:hypothetical protein
MRQLGESWRAQGEIRGEITFRQCEKDVSKFNTAGATCGSSAGP